MPYTKLVAFSRPAVSMQLDVLVCADKPYADSQRYQGLSLSARRPTMTIFEVLRMKHIHPNQINNSCDTYILASHVP